MTGSNTKRPNVRLLIPRLQTFIASLLVMLAGLAGAKYALFRYELERILARHSTITCYFVAPPPPPEWNLLYALPSVTEALVIVVLAGLFGIRSRVAKARRRLGQQLLDENRFPDDVARQLRDKIDHD